jgi:hypothetical protein
MERQVLEDFIEQDWDVIFRFAFQYWLRSQTTAPVLKISAVFYTEGLPPILSQIF